MGGVPEQEPLTNEKKVWKSQHSEHGSITITDDGWRNWRQATIQDVGAIVLFHDSCGKLDEFGEICEIEEVPDEDFPDETQQMALVSTQSG
jgi:hypothetical protein